MENYDKYLGQTFNNRYKVEQIIGAGGMSVVYKATDILMKREVAIKVLKDDIAKNEIAVERFINESKAVSILSHPNIVHIYDVSFEEDIKYIVMEYVEGITLKNYLSKVGTIPFSQALYYTEQILCGLSHAHNFGVLHKDIKPQNILINKRGKIKITDFGIAQLPNYTYDANETDAIGTIYYASPEQINGEKLDSCSDIYSVGIMLYEMITGKLPFDGDSISEIAEKQKNEIPENPSNYVENLPSEVNHLIMKSLKKNPFKRYRSASQMFMATKKILENYKSEVNAPLSKLLYRQPRAKKKAFDTIVKVLVSLIIVASLSISALLILDSQSTISDPTETTSTTERTDNKNILKDYSNQDYIDVIIDLANLGYAKETIFIYDDQIKANNVVFTSPAAGTELEKGQLITVYVSKGLEP